MKFNVTDYQQARSAIIDRIKSTHNWQGDEGFIADGVICPAVFEKESVKILCVLAESHGYEGYGCVDIEDQLEYDLMGLKDPKVKTPRHLATMLYLLTTSLERQSKVTLEEWREVPYLLQVRDEHAKTLQSILAKIAWVNVKKASNPNTRKNSELVREHARRNREILRDQISSISPDLVIICGNDVFSVLIELELLPSSCKQGSPWKVQNGDGRKFIEVSHPASGDWMGYGEIYDIYETIYDQLA